MKTIKLYFLPINAMKFNSFIHCKSVGIEMLKRLLAFYFQEMNIIKYTFIYFKILENYISNCFKVNNKQ